MNIATIKPAAQWAARPLPTKVDAELDIDAILDSFKLQTIRRYFEQVHWNSESVCAARSDKYEPGLKLENVAAHSWHVADAAMLLADYFSSLDLARVLSLAILHDKLEIFTGDFDPIGVDGQGIDSHAFCPKRRREKAALENDALKKYLSSLRPSARPRQKEIFEEIINGKTPEALFVKAVDKLQALAFVHLKKAGRISDQHLVFTLRYSKKTIAYFPPLSTHYAELVDRFLENVAKQRSTGVRSLCNRLSEDFGDDVF